MTNGKEPVTVSQLKAELTREVEAELKSQRRMLLELKDLCLADHKLLLMIKTDSHRHSGTG